MKTVLGVFAAVIMVTVNGETHVGADHSIFYIRFSSFLRKKIVLIFLEYIEVCICVCVGVCGCVGGRGGGWSQNEKFGHFPIYLVNFPISFLF